MSTKVDPQRIISDVRRVMSDWRGRRPTCKELKRKIKVEIEGFVHQVMGRTHISKREGSLKIQARKRDIAH